MKALGLDRSVDLDKMLDEYGASDKSGMARPAFERMVTAYLAHSFLSPEQLQVLRSAFQLVDKDASGAIDEDEFREVGQASLPALRTCRPARCPRAADAA
jgi:hypothetical protein